MGLHFRKKYELDGETFCEADLILSKVVLEHVFALIEGRWINIESGYDATDLLAPQIARSREKEENKMKALRFKEILESKKKQGGYNPNNG